jgi:hypothetical protein
MITNEVESAVLPDALRDFVDSSQWTFARTMPEWPLGPNKQAQMTRDGARICSIPFSFRNERDVRNFIRAPQVTEVTGLSALCEPDKTRERVTPERRSA